jgi:hypothetical protein
MPKPKRGRSLFDLLPEDDATTPDGSRVPQPWANGEKQVADAKAAAVPPRPKPDQRVGSRTGGKVETPAGPSRFVELEGDRFRVSFTSLTAAVAVFAAVVVAITLFKIGDRGGYARGYAAGRASYEAAAMSEIDAARSLPPATQLVEGLLAQPGEQQEPEPIDGAGERAVPRWIRDHTYVVAQEFPASSAPAADVVREYLAEHGIETELVRYPSGAIQLITREGYSLKDPTQREMAEQLLRRVHAVGSEYYAAGGGYKLEGYFKTLKGDSW